MKSIYASETSIRRGVKREG